MCGICGFVVDNAVGFGGAARGIEIPEKLKELTISLLQESQSRGTHATGVAAVTRELKIGMYKKAIMADYFVQDKTFDEFAEKFLTDKTRIVFGHTRFETKGTQQNNFNNHPILSGDVIGVHNGVIQNDEVLWRKEGVKQDRRGKVDSEVIFHLLDLVSKRKGFGVEDAIYEISKHLTGSYACAAVHAKKPKYLWLFCKQNPIYIYSAGDNLGLKIFASSEMYIEKALADIGLGIIPERMVKVPNGTGLRIDANSGKIKRLALHANVACGYSDY